jgi:hypothetical protein
MTPEEQADWDDFNRRYMSAARNSPQEGGDRPCSDCTAEYAAEQRALGLCIGFPGPQRYCRRCGRWWPIGIRYWARYTRRERAPVCRYCRRRVQRARHYSHNRERIRASQAIYKAGHREELRDAERARRAAERVAA